jgi:hypothetical protein
MDGLTIDDGTEPSDGRRGGVVGFVDGLMASECDVGDSPAVTVAVVEVKPSFVSALTCRRSERRGVRET